MQSLDLGVMEYEVFLHLLYLLKSIDLLNLIQKEYIQEVKKGLKGFMDKIADTLVKSSIYLYALMNNLIQHFCLLINKIFEKIKTKLLFYLDLVKKQISIDNLNLSYDLLSVKIKLSELKSLSNKYIQILDKVKGSSKNTSKLLSNAIGNQVSIFSALNKVLCKLLCKLKSISSSCDKLTGISCCTEHSSGSSNGCKSKDNIVVTWKEKSRHQLKVSIMNIEPSDITKFQKSLESIKNVFKITDLSNVEPLKKIMPIIEKLIIVETINKSKSGVTVSPFTFHLKLISDFQKYLDIIKKILEMMEIFGLPVPKEIMSIKEQLDVLDPVKLVKLNLLIKQIQNLYLNILLRGYLLLCTIEFYKEIQPIIYSLCECLKFESCNVSQFLVKCSQVEKNGQNVCTKIDDCIKKLAKASNKCGIKRIEELNQILLKLIHGLSVLKFYVDLMEMEIIIST